jgi:hypothetical protein
MVRLLALLCLAMSVARRKGIFGTAHHLTSVLPAAVSVDVLRGPLQRDPSSRPLLLVFILLTITFFVLALGAFSSQAGLKVLEGYLGLITAIGAWYVSAITVIASTRKALKM